MIHVLHVIDAFFRGKDVSNEFVDLENPSGKFIFNLEDSETEDIWF